MEINCSHLGCSITPAYKCLCINESPVFCESHLREHILGATKRHIVEKYKILSQEEIANIRIAELKALCKNINSLQTALLAKEEDLFAPKINKFLNSIDSELKSIREILNYLKSDEELSFYEKFESTYEETLSKYQEKLKSLEAEINRIEDIRFFTAEDSWAHQISEEEMDSDYKKLRTEIKPFKLDELYAYTILWFLDNYSGDMHTNEFFNTTNFCDKEKILKNVAENLNEKREDVLYQIINMTKNNEKLAQSGSNAMSILVKKKIDFEGKDFSGVYIPYANLSYGIFYKTDFSESDLSHCNLFCAQFLNTNTSKTILPSSFQNNESKEIVNKINSLAFSHDGSWIAACQNQKVKLYDSYSSKLKKKISAENIELCLQVVSWSFDDTFIASSDFLGKIYIWNSWDENSKLESSFHYDRGLVKAIWAPNDDRIAVYSSYGSIKVWNYKTTEIFFEENMKVNTALLLWSPSGKYLVYYYESDFICICNSTNNQLIAKHRHSDIYSLDWIFNEESLVFGGKGPNITIWNFPTDKTHSFSNGISSGIRVLKWNKALSLLACGAFEGSINIWKIYPNDDTDHTFSNYIEMSIFCHWNNIECLGWAEKNNLLGSGGIDGTLKVWKIHKNHVGNRDEDTEETKTFKSRNESEIQHEIIQFNESLLWGTEASYFIKAEPVIEDLNIIKTKNKMIRF